jgi:hypothetical protein
MNKCAAPTFTSLPSREDKEYPALEKLQTLLHLSRNQGMSHAMQAWNLFLETPPFESEISSSYYSFSN